MSRLQKALEHAPWLVMDGALGTLMEDRGYRVDNPLWGSAALLDAAGVDVVAGAHRDYLEVGADVIIANTHNADLPACVAFCGPDADPEEARELMARVNRRAVQAARRHAGPATLIAAGVRSPDRPYARAATLSGDDIARGLEDRVRLLDELGLDAIIFEMISTAADVEGVARVATDLKTPVGIGFTCGADGRTHGGVDPARAAERLAGSGAAVSFVQCTHHADVDAPLRALLRVGATPVGVYANAGKVWHRERWEGEAIGPAGYAQLAVRWIEAGARIVGSCCGTGPEHTRALAALRRS